MRTSFWILAAMVLLPVSLIAEENLPAPAPSTTAASQLLVTVVPANDGLELSLSSSEDLKDPKVAQQNGWVKLVGVQREGSFVYALPKGLVKKVGDRALFAASKADGSRVEATILISGSPSQPVATLERYVVQKPYAPSAFELDFLGRVNAVRAAQNRAPLAWDPAISQRAVANASIARPLKIRRNRLEVAGDQVTGRYEGKLTSVQLIQFILDSTDDGAREVILNPGAKTIGVGVAKSGYWTIGTN